MYIDDIKLFAKSEKKNGDSDTNNKNIQPGYRNGICHEKMCLTDYEKWGKKKK